MRIQTGLLLAVALCLVMPTAAAVRGKDAMYVGGTISSIPENTKGKFDLSDPSAARFGPKKGEPLAIPYERVTAIEYGQKAGRRVGAALVVSPLFLFSKKRKHYVTISFTDENGQGQAAVFELSKGVVHEVVSTFETRSGKKIEFESDEARKQYEEAK
ncbi:MAG: hypothetical protein ACRD4U_03880 [Candidatus Acidiferrales bacterium]